MPAKQSTGYIWLIWALGAAFFFSEYFARVSTGVMIPNLMQAFQVNATSIGAMSAFFYYAYVGMQIPVGALVDRFGTRRLLTITAAICGIGCLLFANTHYFFVAKAARFLMGFGAAFAFVGTLKLVTIWFPSERIGFLAGLTQALGMLGAALGEGPLSLSVEMIGWRSTMMVIGGILLALSIFIGLIVRDGPRQQSPATHGVLTWRSMFAGLGLVVKNPQSWILGIYVGLLYAPTAAFAELWGVSYLVKTYALHTETAAAAIGMVFIGWGTGGPLVGWISDRMQCRRPVMLLSMLGSLVLISLVLYVHLPTTLLFIALFCYGVANTGVAISYAVASEINPHHVAGTSMAFANMASVLVGALLQPVIGMILDYYWDGTIVDQIRIYSAHAFHMAMWILPLTLLLGFFVALFVKETHCKSL